MILSSATGMRGPAGADGSGGGGSSEFSINASTFGAVGDGRKVINCIFVLSDTLVTSPVDVFVPGDVGKLLSSTYTSGTVVDFTTNIASYIDARNVRVAAVSPFASSTASVYFGTDDTDALNAGIDYISASALIKTLVLNPGVFLTRTGLNLYKSGTKLRGAGDAGHQWSIHYPGDRTAFYTYTFPVPYGAYTGTIITYVGPYSLTGYVLKVVDTVDANDIWRCECKDFTLDGRGLCGNVLELRATVRCSFADISAFYPISAVGVVSYAINLASLPYSSRDFISYTDPTVTRINGNYSDTFLNVHGVASGYASGWHVSGLTGYAATCVAFCNFTNCRMYGGRSNNTIGGLVIDACDDNGYFNCDIGGNLVLAPAFGKTVETQTFYQLLVEAGSIYARGSACRRNKIYGLSGTDNAVVVSITNGAQLFYDYMGDGGASSDTGDESLHRTAPLKIAGPHMLEVVSTAYSGMPADAMWSSAPLGAYAGKIRIKVWTSGSAYTYKWIPVYD